MNILEIFIIIFGIFLRLIPHIPNFSPITATAIFSGVYLNKRSAILVPLLTMVISDYLISPENMLHSTSLFVWGSFIISGIIGIRLKRANNPLCIYGGSILASLQFFFITNFGVWLTSNMYSHNLGGLIESYMMGIPFYRNTLIGDLFYVTAIFGAYEFLKTKTLLSILIED
jgi:hypothetical protein